MNQRIKELAEQAGITFKPMVIDGIEYEYRHVNINDNKAEDEAGCIEQLVELIVRECAEVLDTWNKENGAEEGHDKEGLISLWDSHFGVDSLDV